LPSLVWERIGKKNIINFTSPVTVFTPTAAELEWGQENLEPHGVALYDDYEQMLSHEGVQAVVVATAAVVHAEEVILAIDHNLQVSSNPRWKSPG
jgi:myo-inositol 2-dehydrogenase / D-chiro-inositol 1-dehydrogenase